jgi:hypothetical protein
MGKEGKMKSEACAEKLASLKSQEEWLHENDELIAQIEGIVEGVDPDARISLSSSDLFIYTSKITIEGAYEVLASLRKHFNCTYEMQTYDHTKDLNFVTTIKTLGVFIVAMPHECKWVQTGTRPVYTVDCGAGGEQ